MNFSGSGMMKTYQVAKKMDWSFAAIMGGWLAFVLVVLWPIFRFWGTAWWIDAIGIGVGVATLGAFALACRTWMDDATLKLEIDSAGLRENNWRGSRLIQWPEVAAWCAVESEEGDRLIRLKLAHSKDPFDIDPVLLEGKQFAEICRDLGEHCGPPRPGAELLGDNDGEPFRDVPL